ncbi:MAG: TIGR03560 family F420-dependent LLM class oxidoreductase [Gammaproteobacteria bacterium]|jgi:F420-dependent oxidoreductase-like protein|nr:TIGR03560 family F420-dependent LLM class oxidoreductase [Gammaproteobacteria bacterium]|tara:strand:- start:1453 stop:2376 length:924 start_codon:yes stop_codon:yes gene_type:complete
MRFGFWPNPRSDYTALSTLAQHAESIGWDGIWLADHFLPDEDELIPVHESWITMAALARDVPRVRLGTLVTGNTYRHPAVLANMVATLDNLSEGRVVLGVGSGWQQNEHEAYGIEYGTASSRLEMLDEACQIFKGLFNNDYFDFDGKHYQLTKAPLEPKPKQSNLPLMIGGGGEKFTLRIAAKYADEWNVWGNVETLIHKMRILDQHCEAISRDPTEIERSAVALLFLTEDESAIKRLKSTPMGMPAIIGGTSEVIDIISAYRDAGVKELIVPDFTLGKLIGAGQAKKDLMEKFITEVAPAFRQEIG